jgi:predicted RNA-binding Zn-ribbon protein involved in translation (DUF1610 family)
MPTSATLALWCALIGLMLILAAAPLLRRLLGPLFWRLIYHPLSRLVRQFRQLRRRSRPTYECPICGYDVVSTPHRCPECGARLSWGILVEPPPGAPRRRVY